MNKEIIETFLTSLFPAPSGVLVENLTRLVAGQSRDTWSLDAVFEVNGEPQRKGLIRKRSINSPY